MKVGGGKKTLEEAVGVAVITETVGQEMTAAAAMTGIRAIRRKRVRKARLPRRRKRRRRRNNRERRTKLMLWVVMTLYRGPMAEMQIPPMIGADSPLRQRKVKRARRKR